MNLSPALGAPSNPRTETGVEGPASSILLPLIPLIKKKTINLNNIIIDSKSGYSGAGKNLEEKFTHKNLYNSTFAYSIKNHRHIVEIEQEIKKHTKKNIFFTFNPYILPTFRGILSSIYVELKGKSSSNSLRQSLIKYYKNSQYGAHKDTALKIFNEFPIFGVGIKNFRYESGKEKYFNSDYSASSVRRATHPHQIHLEFLSGAFFLLKIASKETFDGWFPLK